MACRPGGDRWGAGGDGRPCLGAMESEEGRPEDDKYVTSCRRWCQVSAPVAPDYSLRVMAPFPLVLWSAGCSRGVVAGGGSRGGRCSSITVEGREILPPLPPQVVALLQATRLCHLSTTDGLVPHLSLMNFTYYQGQRRWTTHTQTGSRPPARPPPCS